MRGWFRTLLAVIVVLGIARALGVSTTSAWMIGVVVLAWCAVRGAEWALVRSRRSPPVR